MPTTIHTPQTMKAAIATGCGGIDENIHVREDWPVPCLDDFGQGFLLVRILACALAPGDVRLLSGKTDYVQLPVSGHPYVVGEYCSVKLFIVVSIMFAVKDGDQFGSYNSTLRTLKSILPCLT
jgi:hypothetical protein